jgi:cystathionine beta-lyase
MEQATFDALSVPVWRASTVLFPDARSFLERKRRFFDGYTYGLAGTPTHTALAARLRALEEARHCVLASSGLGAIHLVNMTVLRAGDHMLCASGAYGPTRENAREVMRRFGVEVEFYEAGEGAAIALRLRPRTRLVWIESPGSIRMEMTDVPAVARAARAAGVLTAMDNTWATPLGFRPLRHGVDFSVQALTKFAGGHSDVLMGSICVDDEAHFRALKTTANLLGSNVSPDDCALVARGLDTLALRLARHGATTAEVAAWLARRPEVAAVHCPALPGDAGHALWRRDFRTAGCLCAIVLREGGWDAAARLLDRLRVFRIGASWGGAHSLAAVYPLPAAPGAPQYIIRLHFGLEEPQALIDDLAQAFRESSPPC